MILIPSLARSLEHGGDLRLLVSSFTVVQGLEPLFKFETKSLDNDLMRQLHLPVSPPSSSPFLILWFIIFRLLSFALCLGSGIGNCWLDWLRLLFCPSFLHHHCFFHSYWTIDNAKHLFSFTGLVSVHGNAKYQTVIDIGRIIWVASI